MKHAQDQRLVSVARYESLSRVSPVGILMFDAAGKCVDVNRRWSEMTGMTRDEALGDGWHAGSHPEDRERVVRQWTSMLHEGLAVPCEHRLRPDQGRVLWVVCQADRITNASGAITGYVRTLTDVTQQKQTEQALRLVSTDLASIRGTAFYEAVALRLAELLQCKITSVCRRDEHRPDQLVTLAWCDDGVLQPNITYDITGTPCAEAAGRGSCIVVPHSVQQQYPDDHFLAVVGAEAYVGVRLIGNSGRQLGHLSIMSCQPLDGAENIEAILNLFALSVVAEMERQESEEALQEAKVFADTIIESVSGLFYVLDRNGFFVRWNQSGQELFGLSTEQMASTNALALIHEDDRERIAGEISEVFANGHAHAEARLLLKDGVRHFLLNGRRMESHGKAYLVGSGADITGRMHAEEEIHTLNRTLAQRVAERTAELTAANAELHKASQAKSEFLTTMSHELRTPLNGILGMNELLSASELTERQRQYVDASSSSGKLLMQLINDVLDLSKIEAGKLDLDPRQCDLLSLVNDVIASMSYAAEQKGLALASQIAADACVTAVCDDSRLRQVLVNLVSNAIKFTSTGSVTLRSDRLADRGGNPWLRFSVADTGIGIPKERHHRLFAAFSQVDSSTTRRFGGTGLGLSICRQLVELMDGQIGVDSQVGVGSTFWFEIPLQIVDAPRPAKKGRPAPKKVEGPVAEPVDGEPDSAPRIAGHVLVAEDNDINQLYVVELLKHYGFTSDVVVNGEQAIAAVTQQQYAMVLMDCQMPEMDGFAATSEIRRREALSESAARLPIVALTANALKGDRQRCLDAGMDEYLSKPVEGEQLKKVLEKILGRPVSPASVSSS